MRLTISFFLFFISVISMQGAAQSFKIEHGIWFLENFEQDEVGALPKQLYNRNGDARPFEQSERQQAGYQYVVKSELGNKFLRFEGTNAKHFNIPLNNSSVNINDTPILSWRWRAHKLPEGGNEDVDQLNDCALSVYVVYELNMFKIPKVIRYTWSSTLRQGKTLSKNFNNQKVIVLQSGTDRLGEWITEQRDIQADYRKLFGGKPPKRPMAILIMSDGDSTNSLAIGDYDDFMLMDKKYFNVTKQIEMVEEETAQHP